MKDLPEKLTPTVHLNGSSSETLIREWLGFKLALENAVEVFPVESCHWRNHYPSFNEEIAQRARWEVVQLLHDLIDASEKIALNIDNQYE